MPRRGQRRSTMTTPPRKKLVPLSLCLWKKKEKVFLRPMMRGRPVRNSRFPKARSTESKYRSTPKRMKKMPKPVVPTPISATGEEVVMGWALECGWGC